MASFTADGDVYFSRFVKLSTAGPGQAAQATSSLDLIYGVSWEPTQGLPMIGFQGTQGLAASSGREFTCLTAPDTGWVTSGASFPINAKLTADSTGRAIQTATAGNGQGGVALQAATGAGQLIQIRVSDPDSVI